MTARHKKILLGGGLLLLLLSIGTIVWIHRFGRYTPAAVYQDLRAASQVGEAERPVERFLELRYGSLTDPANRQTALLDFFNLDHIEGLYLIVSRLPAPRRQANIAAMAQWIASCREATTAEEKQALQAHFASGEGKARIRRATAGYLKKDSRFRAETAPVIQELMTTLVAIQQP